MSENVFAIDFPYLKNTKVKEQNSSTYQLNLFLVIPSIVVATARLKQQRCGAKYGRD
tara:strand:+ start:871 stop:1041 length:171 start_codon:yes stop_codon:yes gene_type:complete